MLNRFFSAVCATAVVLGSAEMCLAKIGDTEAELDKRYGSPVFVQMPPEVLPPAEKKKMWMLDGPPDTVIVVTALLHKGRCVRECHEIRADGKNVPLKTYPAQVKAVLDANSLGGTWREGHPDFINPNFVMELMRSDEKAFAYTWKNDPEVLIVDDITFIKECIRAAQ